MKAIEKGLADVHSSLLGSSGVTSSQAPTSSSKQQSNDAVGIGESFAIVGFVDDGSPADLAVSILQSSVVCGFHVLILQL